MDADELTFAQAANQLEQELTAPDVSLIVDEAGRRAERQTTAYRSIVGIGVIGAIIVAAFWSTNLGQNQVDSAAAQADQTMAAPVTTSPPESITTTTTTSPVVQQASGLNADVDSPTPGAAFTITSTRNIIGGWFSFERADGDQWIPVVTALQAREINGTARSIPLGQDFDTDDIGLENPVTLEIPADTEPGTYRVCELGTNRCTTITVS